MAKILEKSGNFVSPEKWEPCTKKSFSRSLGNTRMAVFVLAMLFKIKKTNKV